VLKALGAGAYPMLMSGSLVLPISTGTPSEEGLDYYRRAVDELLATTSRRPSLRVLESCRSGR
jgi:beta-glucosidase/6-phospho-beta-glucosidase/beta-galactosidase